MIATVINISELKRTVIVIVIEQENLERMSKADPATLESPSLGGILPDIDYPTNYGVLVAYEPNEVELYKAARGNPMEFLQYLERGRKFKPDIDGTEKAVKIPRSKMKGQETKDAG